MPPNIRILLIIFSCAFFLGFIALIKHRSVKSFYSFLWLIVTLGMISIVIFEKFYKGLATMLGISDASFMIIVALIAFLMVYVFYLSVKTSEMNDRIQELISATAILEHDLRKLRDEA